MFVCVCVFIFGTNKNRHQLTFKYVAGLLRLQGILIETDNGGIGTTVRTGWPSQGIQTYENILMATISGCRKTGAKQTNKINNQD